MQGLDCDLISFILLVMIYLLCEGSIYLTIYHLKNVYVHNSANDTIHLLSDKSNLILFSSVNN